MSKVLTCEKLTKVYGKEKTALDGIDLELDFGRIVGLLGPNGSGKTTLLNCISTIDTVSAGHIYLDGTDVTEINEKQIARFRRENLGFVFQDFNLLDNFSLKDNIVLPLVLSGVDYKEMERRITPIAAQLGILDILGKYPYEVSGGQKQRAAVARALIIKPELVLADEPTGALDSKATEDLLTLFNKINERGQTILMVTHSTKAASHARRVLFIKDGEVFHQIYRGNLTSEELYAKISDTLTMLTTGGEKHE